MSVRLYMDEHVHSAITGGLRARGVDVLTVQDDARRSEDDTIVLSRAGALGRVLFTQDDDLLVEAARRRTAGERFGGVIYAHQMTVPIGQCIQDLELIAGAGFPEEFADRVFYLPIR